MDLLHLLIAVFNVLEELESQVLNAVREVVLESSLELFEHVETIFTVHLDSVLLLHEAKVCKLLWHDEGERGARGSDTSGSANSVDIVLDRAREVVLDDPGYLFEVEASRGNICADQD